MPDLPAPVPTGAVMTPGGSVPVPPEGGKAAFRTWGRARRRDARRANPEAGERLQAVFLQADILSTPALPDRPVIAGYWPQGAEIDPRPLMQALQARGLRLALPAVTARNAPLAFRAWTPGTPLRSGAHGTSEPPEDAAGLRPDLMLCPLVAFDRAGHRLGQGGGYYDRTLAALRSAGPVLAVGLAFAAQEAEMLPSEAHDMRLDWVVTDRAAHRFRAAGTPGEGGTEAEA